MKTPEFTREDIIRASLGIGIGHPVLDVLTTIAPRINKVSEEASLKDNATGYINLNSDFLADAIENAAPFSLEPLELMAIWSRNPGFRRFRYIMATALGASYAIQGVENRQDWRRFPCYFIKNNEIPEGARKNPSSINYVFSRLEEIDNKVKSLDLVIYGTTEQSRDILIKIGRRIRSGDQMALKEYNDFSRMLKEKEIPVYEDLAEAFGNGFSNLFLALDRVIKT